MSMTNSNIAPVISSMAMMIMMASDEFVVNEQMQTDNERIFGNDHGMTANMNDCGWL